jgi:NADPH-dependent 2,4-dienoyl-CoA reductase/sulfur reductase-like enzyme
MGVKLIIVGGVAGGATAAARARRVSEDAEIIIFERGEYISFANCGLPYYIGNVIKKRDHLLLATPEEFKQRYNVDVRIFSEVVGINPKEKAVEIKNPSLPEHWGLRWSKCSIWSWHPPAPMKNF